MTNSQIILDYAKSHNRKIVRKEFMSWLQSAYPSASRDSMDVVIHQMLRQQILNRESRGILVLSSASKTQYIPNIGERENDLFMTLKSKYPYTKICIWHSNAASSLTQHVPYANNTIVEVERIAAEAVFQDLKMMASVPVLLAPTDRDYQLYASQQGNIIVHPMISESPTLEINGVVTPSLEKILVDITIEPEFGFARDNELNIIYENATERFVVDKRKMLRYASRRGKKDEIEKLINSTML